MTEHPLGVPEQPKLEDLVALPFLMQVLAPAMDGSAVAVQFAMPTILLMTNLITPQREAALKQLNATINDALGAIIVEWKKQYNALQEVVPDD